MNSSESARSVAHAKALRERTLSETRRELILEAARAAFLDVGLDGASLREIAKRAGYTPGALYTYFSSLEEIYAALLHESLKRLQASVDGALVAPGITEIEDPASQLAGAAHAFYAYYRDNPKDLDLGFYLFNGARPRGLTTELNKQLNKELMGALDPIRQALQQLGLSAEDAIVETTGIFAHVVGTLMLANTGRIRLFRQDPDTVFRRYVEALLVRLPAPAS